MQSLGMLVKVDRSPDVVVIKKEGNLKGKSVATVRYFSVYKFNYTN